MKALHEKRPAVWSDELTPRQIALLRFGEADGLAGRGFINGEELSAWTRHRGALLAESGTARPHAYFQYELSPETPGWIGFVEKLFWGGLFRDASIETTCITMAPNQPRELHREFETPEGIRGLCLANPDLEKMLREFGLAAAWHKYRDRPALADKYLRIGAAVRAVLRESLVMLKKGEL